MIGPSRLSHLLNFTSVGVISIILTEISSPFVNNITSHFEVSIILSLLYSFNINFSSFSETSDFSSRTIPFDVKAKSLLSSFNSETEFSISLINTFDFGTLLSELQFTEYPFL